MKRLFLFLSLIAILLVVASCSNNSNKGPKSTKWRDTLTSGAIYIASDQCFEPVIQAQVAVFESQYLEAGIVPIFTGEMETIRLLMDDSVRLAVVSRELTEREKAVFTSKNMVVRELKIATDAIALIVNKSNEESMIGMPTLKKILTGEITEWKQINPKSKLGKIDVIFDNPNSGTVRYAIDSITGGQGLSDKLYAQENNLQAIEMVSKIPGALGIIGVNWISNENDSTNLSFNDKIKVLAVSRYASPDQYNSYLPFQAYVVYSNYPMIRSVYILLSDPKNGLSTGFASFVTSDRGQRIILKSGLVPATMPINIVNVHDRYPN